MPRRHDPNKDRIKLRYRIAARILLKGAKSHADTCVAILPYAGDYCIISGDSEEDIIGGIKNWYNWYQKPPESQTLTPAAAALTEKGLEDLKSRLRSLEAFKNRCSLERKEAEMKDMQDKRGWRKLPDLPEGVELYMEDLAREHYKATIKFPIEVAIWQHEDMKMKRTLFKTISDVPIPMWRDIDLYRPITMMTEVFSNGAFHKTLAT